MSPFISVIVPVRNEERFLAETLRPLFHQDYDPGRYEILVIDGRSTDNTPGVVRELQVEFPQLHLLDNPKRLSSAARNVGVRAARGEYVVIVDGHCELRSRTYLRDLAAAFERSGADCLGRPQPLEVAGASPVQQAIALARASRLGHNPGSHIYSDSGGFVKPQSVAVAYRRCVFDRVGLFDESFDACEDVEFNGRVDAAGLTCYFAPELAVNYHPRETLAGLVYQMGRYGRGRARLALKNPASLTLPAMVPAVFLTGLAAAFVLGLAAPVFAAVFCGSALIYSSVVALAGLWLAARRGAAGLSPLVPAVFLAIHVGAGGGVLAELAPGLLRRSIRRVRPVARALRPTSIEL
jgi:succinoglycan biosynthesis protein ExoA